MFQHQSLGIKVNIRVTKLVLLRSRPVSSNPFLPCCCNRAVVVTQAAQAPAPGVGGESGARLATSSQIVISAATLQPVLKVGRVRAVGVKGAAGLLFTLPSKSLPAYSYEAVSGVNCYKYKKCYGSGVKYITCRLNVVRMCCARSL